MTKICSAVQVVSAFKKMYGVCKVTRNLEGLNLISWKSKNQKPKPFGNQVVSDIVVSLKWLYTETTTLLANRMLNGKHDMIWEWYSKYQGLGIDSAWRN